MLLNSIEIDESMYPVLVEARAIAKDALGSGEWDGAPGTAGVYRSLAGEMTAIYGSDGDVNAPRGVLGGHDAQPSANWKHQANGERVRLPAFGEATCRPDERLEFRACSGGGYGDPARRDPRRVVAAVNRGWLSPERAEAIYKVALRRAPDGVDFELDREETARRRGAAG